MSSSSSNGDGVVGGGGGACWLEESERGKQHEIIIRWIIRITFLVFNLLLCIPL